MTYPVEEVLTRDNRREKRHAQLAQPCAPPHRPWVIVVDACEARAIAAPHHLFEEREQPAIGAQMQVGRVMMHEEHSRFERDEAGALPSDLVQRRRAVHRRRF